PIFGILAGKYGLKKIYMLGLLITGSSFLILFFMGWTLLTAIIPLLLIGIGFSAIILLRPPIVADIIDFDETITGKRRETSYAGMNAVIEKPAISLANWLFLIIIASYGFKDQATTQSSQAQLGIMIALTIIPGILIVIAAVVMKFYPLDGPEWKQKKLEISKIHEEKEKKYLEYLREKGKI
ncbi:MAG: MFS transporter, partial [Candidatus Hermodarchaeota archaeon]